MAKNIDIAGRLHSMATGNVVAGADEILDDRKGKKQDVINQETDAALATKAEQSDVAAALAQKADAAAVNAALQLKANTTDVERELATKAGVNEMNAALALKSNAADVYTKNETYSKEQLNNLITTPDQQYITVTATDETTDVTELLPAEGDADTIYRVGNWDANDAETPYDTTCYSEYAWDGTEYVPLSVKHPGIDEVPTPNSSNLVESGGIAEYYGDYRVCNEWIRAITDHDGRILVGIRYDGHIYFAAGIPTQIQEEIDKKQDAIFGKSLIDKDFAEGVGYVDNDEFVKVILGDDNRILWGVRRNGDILLGAGIPSQISEYIGLTFGRYIENSEFIRLYLDRDEHPLLGIRKNGDIYFGAGVPTQIDVALKKWYTTENKEVVDLSSVEYQPEFVDVLIDKDKHVLFGIRKDGDVYFGKGVPTQVKDAIAAVSKEVENNAEQIALLQEGAGNTTKVVYRGFDDYPSRPFYIRAKYNAEKDIVITHYINDNGLVSFDGTYVGPNDLSDSALMTSTYSVSAHNDSTAPLLSVTQYWHLFAQHGYPVPYIDNSVGMTIADTGALWQDQLNRQYNIGKVTTTRIYLLPVIYQDNNGHYVRDWHSDATSTAITALTYVSGGSPDAHTAPIATVSGYSQEQLYPIMTHSGRVMYADDKQITEPGTYYCNEFKVSESQEGYDPATITNWFGGQAGKVDLTGAEVMAKFTFSYTYCGAQCSMKTTIDIRREVECASYGALQQQFFIDKGNYKAMFMIPKAATRGGVVFDRPFHSPSRQSQTYIFYRTAEYLKDVNDPIDRMIGMLHDDTNNTYLVGMAAGLSLINGETVREKRILNCPIGASNTHYRLGSISPSNINKFYVAAVNTANYENEGYYLPTTYFKEIDCYISYFDPAENVGQVYWYKEGNEYVVYCHCQTAQDRIAINIPSIMEGLSIDVVEKTTGTTLFSDTVQNGKIFVSYSNDVNYIVLKVK